MSATERLLARLDGVRGTGPGRWIARCPAHADRSPSLSIRELDDGRVLVHDFGGCGVGDVLAAVGFEMKALFPQRLGHDMRRTHSRIPARDLLEVVGFEVDVAVIILREIMDGSSASELAWSRLAKAAARIGAARVYLHGRR